MTDSPSQDRNSCPNGPDEHGEWPCDPEDNGDGTATCSECGYSAEYAQRPTAQFIRVIDGVPTLVTEEIA